MRCFYEFCLVLFVCLTALDRYLKPRCLGTALLHLFATIASVLFLVLPLLSRKQMKTDGGFLVSFRVAVYLLYSLSKENEADCIKPFLFFFVCVHYACLRYCPLDFNICRPPVSAPFFSLLFFCLISTDVPAPT